MAMMEIVAQGIISSGTAGTTRATHSFPAVTALTDGPILATYRTGSDKDSADGQLELCRSLDNGDSWLEPEQPFQPMKVEGKSGTLRVAYLTEIKPGHLMVAALWVDRESYPNHPLFNPETEGCLPMAILIAESFDTAVTWTPWRVVPIPVEIGPPSLTNPILKLPNGTLILSVESNKQYNDHSKWYQRVVLFRSPDQGQTWAGPLIAGQDPSGRIFNWDQRVGVAPDGRLVTFNWTFDSKTNSYCNIHRRISADQGVTWTMAADLGFADQPARPAILPDGSLVLAWVDRFGTQSIRGRWASAVDQPFLENSELIIYKHRAVDIEESEGTLSTLESMTLWSFGLPYAETLPNGQVLIVYYAGTLTAMDINWCRLKLTGNSARLKR